MCLTIHSRHCAGRIWRSHIEAVADPKEEFASLLIKTQKERIVCKCSSWEPGACVTQPENKLLIIADGNMVHRGNANPSKIFDFTESSHFKLSPELQSKLKRKREIPDKVFSLRMTGTLHWLLKHKDKREEYSGQTVEEALSPTLFPQNWSPMVFPFLLVESKTDSSTDSFQAIHQQLALLANESLLIQDRLRKAASSTKWIAGPLVWCLSHKGPWWQLSAGYNTDKKKRVRVVSN